MGLSGITAPPPGGPFYVDEHLHEGWLYKFAGKNYRYRGNGHWYLEEGGRSIYVQGGINVIFQPFMGDTYKQARGVPLALWPNATTVLSSTPFATIQQINAPQICRVGLYADCNTSTEIPLVDSAGEPFIDPSVPPWMIMRYNSINSTDYIGAYSSNTPVWTDENVGQRPIAEVLVQPMFYATARLEKEPTPHWTVTIHYYDNNTATNKKSIIVDCQGAGLPGTNASTSVDNGYGSGTVGHWKVENLLPQSDFLSTGSLATAQTRIAGRESAYILNNASQAFYLTDTGLVGGANYFDATFPPTVLVKGGGGTGVGAWASEADWDPTSRGIGFTLGGFLADGVTNIGDGNSDQFNAYSEVGRDSGKWKVAISNISGSGGRTPGNRNFAYFAFGKTP